MERIKHYGHVSIKFLDVMFGAIVAIGFGQWFSVDERESLFFISFLFAHIILIDVWVNYDPTVRKFPTKNPYFLVLDLALIFTMAFLIYYSMSSLHRFLLSIIALRLVGVLWSERSLIEYKPGKPDATYLKHTRNRNFVEAAVFAMMFIVLKSVDAYALVGTTIVLWSVFRVYDHIKVRDMVKSDAD